jgi:hypothetical protein
MTTLAQRELGAQICQNLGARAVTTRISIVLIHWKM